MIHKWSTLTIAKNMSMFLLHYTNLTNAYLIIKHKKVFFNDLTKCNDQREIDYQDPTGPIRYIFCCSASPLNSSGWLSYSSGKDGAAIEFVFNEGFEYKDLLVSNERLDSFLIKYAEDLDDFIPAHLDYVGKAKDSFFEAEQEYRFLIESDCEGEKLYLKLNNKAINKIILHVSRHSYELAKDLFNSFKNVSVVVNKFVS